MPTVQFKNLTNRLVLKHIYNLDHPPKQQSFDLYTGDIQTHDIQSNANKLLFLFSDFTIFAKAC